MNSWYLMELGGVETVLPATEEQLNGASMVSLILCLLLSLIVQKNSSKSVYKIYMSARHGGTSL